MSDEEACRERLPWVEDGLFSCTRTRLLNRVEPVTGRALSLVSVDVLVQIRPDLRLRFATLPPARRAITVFPLPQRPRSVRIRSAPFVVFSSTASDVLHTRPCCSHANPPCTLCSGSSASSCLTCVRPALPHHSRARTRVFAPPRPTPVSAKPLARARQSRLQRPPRTLRSTPVHTTHFRTPSLARLRHPLGVAHIPAAPAPVLARCQFACVAPHQLMPEPFAPTQLRSLLVRSAPAHPFLLCRPASALSLVPQLLHSPGVHAPAPANSERQNRTAASVHSPPRQSLAAHAPALARPATSRSPHSCPAPPMRSSLLSRPTKPLASARCRTAGRPCRRSPQRPHAAALPPARLGRSPGPHSACAPAPLRPPLGPSPPVARAPLPRPGAAHTAPPWARQLAPPASCSRPRAPLASRRVAPAFACP
jgi:hypothetical protein